MTLQLNKLAVVLALVVAALGSAVLARLELAAIRDAFETDARIAHRLLSQRAVQQDAVMAMLTWDQSGNCEGEAMLTVGGKAHARKIGEEFARRGIRPAVISSPMCRCRDTAQIAFGQVPVTDAALRETASADPQRTATFERKAQLLIASRRGASPVIFVHHRPNIDLLSMELISEGEPIVARSNANGELVVVLGKIIIQP